MPTTTVSIPGIHCSGCASLIQDVSSEFPNVESVRVDLATKQVTLTHTPAFNLTKWKEEIEAIDPKYTVQLQ